MTGFNTFFLTTSVPFQSCEVIFFCCLFISVMSHQVLIVCILLLCVIIILCTIITPRLGPCLIYCLLRVRPQSFIRSRELLCVKHCAKYLLCKVA